MLGYGVLGLLIQLFVIYILFLLGLRASGVASPGAARRAYALYGICDAVLTAAGTVAVMWLLIRGGTSGNAIPLVLLSYAVATGPSTWMEYEDRRIPVSGSEGSYYPPSFLPHLAYLAASLGHLVYHLSLRTTILLLAGAIVTYKLIGWADFFVAWQQTERGSKSGISPRT